MLKRKRTLRLTSLTVSCFPTDTVRSGAPSVKRTTSCRVSGAVGSAGPELDPPAPAVENCSGSSALCLPLAFSLSMVNKVIDVDEVV